MSLLALLLLPIGTVSAQNMKAVTEDYSWTSLTY